MKKNDGSSTRVGSAVKVLLIDDKPSVCVGKELVHVRDELDAPGAKRAMLEAFEYLNKATERNNLFMNHPPMDFNKPIPLFPSPNSKNSKRMERLNTAAGLPAKKRCFCRSFKRLAKKALRSLRDVPAVMIPLDSNREPISSAMYLVSRLTLFSDYGNSISGSVASVVMMNGGQAIVASVNLTKKELLRLYSKGTTI